MLGKEKIRVRFPQSATRQEVVNGNSASLQIQGREALVIPLPITMHTGQIIMLTKMMTSNDLRIYEFDTGVPVQRWRSQPSGSS